MHEPDTFNDIWATFQAQGTEDLDPLSSIDTLSLAATPGTSTVLLPAPESRGIGPADIPVHRLPTLRSGTREADPDLDLEVRGDLGQGGMGKVELAVQRSLRREVAVKTVLPEHESQEGVLALIQEALFTGYLEHPNIVPVHRLGRDAEDRPVLVMKRVSGTVWRDTIQRRPDDLAGHLETLMQVCNAVHFAHSRGVVHRDIKPENIMIGDFGEVYLLDWGLAVRLDRLDASSDAIVGTPAYMAPEMLSGAGAVDARTDVYLLGATLHEVLTGSPRHRSTTMRGTLLSVLQSAPHSYGPEIPSELADLCNRATHADPERRPATALELRQALERFLQHQGSVQLSRHSEDLLEELTTAIAASSAEVGTLFAECRFGFDQALREWPENTTARQGLQACLERMIDHQLQQRNKGLVEALMGDLPEPRPQLTERLERLRAELEEEAATPERLRRLEHDLDVQVSHEPRAIFLFVLAILAASATEVAAQIVRHGLVEFTHQVATLIVAGFPVVIGLGALLGKRWFLATTINRRLTGSFLMGSISVFLNHVVCWIGGTSVPQAFIADCSLWTLTVMMIAITIDTRAYAVTAVCLAMTLGCAFWPDYVLDIQAAGAFCGFGLAALLFKFTDPPKTQEA